MPRFRNARRPQEGQFDQAAMLARPLHRLLQPETRHSESGLPWTPWGETRHSDSGTSILFLASWLAEEAACRDLSDLRVPRTYGCRIEIGRRI